MLTTKEEALIKQHINADIRRLALSLKSEEGVRKEIVLQQIAGRQTMRHKVPSWAAVDNIIYPKHLSMEQCSSETTARYKASLVGSGELLIDLTGGFGVDFIFMAQAFRHGIYVEVSDELCNIARHNFKALRSGETTIVCGNGVQYMDSLNTKADIIYIDPARRNKDGGKTVRIADCTPDLTAIEEMLVSKSNKVIAKLSPMLDINDALSRLSHVNEVHIVSTDNECKELLFVMSSAPTSSVSTVAVNITNGTTQRFVCQHDDEGNTSCRYTDTLCRYLYEPNSSIMKSGAFKCVAAHFDIDKLNPNSHLYTNDSLIDNFPGRRFEIIHQFGFSKNELSVLKEYKQANIAVRNFPLRPDELKKKLKLKDGGEIYIFATTLNNGKHVLAVCKKV